MNSRTSDAPSRSQGTSDSICTCLIVHPTKLNTVEALVNLDLVQTWLNMAKEKASACQFDSATGLLTKAIQGIDKYNHEPQWQYKAMSLLSFVHASQGNWPETQNTLELLGRWKSGLADFAKFAPDAMHAVAKYHYSRNLYEEARQWCEKAVIWRMEAGETSLLQYYLSIDLLAEISYAQGEIEAAEGWGSKVQALGDEFEGMSFIKRCL